MNARSIAVAIAIATATLVCGCNNNEQSGDLGPAIDAANAAAVHSDTAVRFELPDMTGTVRQSSEWDGKPKLLNFWATWCAPCRREIPLLKKTQDEYAELNLQIIGIAVDFHDDVVAYAEEAEFNYPILVGQEEAMAVAETSGVDFIGLPFTMVVSSFRRTHQNAHRRNRGRTYRAHHRGSCANGTWRARSRRRTRRTGDALIAARSAHP